MRHQTVFILLLWLCCSFAQAQQRESISEALERQGMVDVQTVDKSIGVSLMYARPDNFTGEVLYTQLRKAYLHPLAAKALALAQAKLKELRPDLTLMVFDAARPMRIQRQMWDKVKHTPKYFYVSNPAHGGGLHNYGLAVDISLCTVGGDTIDMGTPIDHMSTASHIDREDALVATRRISKAAQQNRRLLRTVMQHAGFRPLRTEWWHFNFRTRAQAKQFFKVIE